MKLSESKKRRLKTGLFIGVLLGVLMTVGVYVMTNKNPASFALLPIFVIMSGLQAITGPADDDE